MIDLMNKNVILATILLMATVGTASADDRGWSGGGGMGLTASPTTFLMNFDLLYKFGNGFSYGPQLQLGLTDAITIMSLAANGRYDFDLSLGSGELSKIRPFLNAGMGLTYGSLGSSALIPGVNVSVGSTGFLITMGGGLEYRLDPRTSLESAIQFNIIASGAGPFDDNFYWSWQILGMRYRF